MLLAMPGYFVPSPAVCFAGLQPPGKLHQENVFDIFSAAFSPAPEKYG
jgi:hypothetical protein